MDVRSAELTYADGGEVDEILTEQPSEQILVQMSTGELCPVVTTSENEMGVKLPADTMEQLRQGKAVLYRVGERNEMWLIQPENLPTHVEHFEDIGVQGIEMSGAVNMEMSGELVEEVEQVPQNVEFLDEHQPKDDEIQEDIAFDAGPSDLTETLKTTNNPVVTSVQQKKLTQARFTPLMGDKPHERSGPVHQCNWCGAAFGSLFHLKRHSHTHTGARPFTCSHCKLSFRHKTSLKVHVRKHTGEMPYTCDVCSKQFRDPANFKVHVRSHSEEKNYECKTCQKRFNSASTLYAHKKIHGNDKPYVCTHCSKSFRFNTTLIRHIRTHTGEKPYSCDLCQTSFSTASNLAAHRRRHETDKPTERTIMYRCDQCGFQFHTKSGLKVHRKQHMNVPAKRADNDMLHEVLEDSVAVETIPHPQIAKPRDEKDTASSSFQQRINLRTMKAVPMDSVLSDSKPLIVSPEKVLPQKTYECATCGKQFDSQQVHAAHLRTHNLSKGITVVYTAQSVR